MSLEIEVATKLAISLILASIIGIDREISNKPAGIRTHALVCVGATIYTICSMLASSADPLRAASGIVTGIGFLGAGTIFKSKSGVQGLTTAANLWVLAGIGLSVGLGYYIIALFATITVLFVLWVEHSILRRLHIKRPKNGD